MGSSGEATEKAIDASVGGLVWVRRRNGSWWPGRILGLDEVSESCVVSPRSGTPVKLLGREDASVDWYNLEKSKRVKSFRCGEYDDCIAKAKASAANSNKKAVKYARREDAIIHALEIENSRLGNDHTDISAGADSLVHENGVSARESPSVSRSGNQNDDNMDEEVSDSEKNPDSAQELSQSGISFEEPNHIRSSSKVRSMQGRRRTPNDSEDDGTEGVKRMKGLEDLGVSVASKRKVPAGGLLELVQQDNASLSDSNNANSLSNRSGVNGSGKGGSSMKRKRTQVANANETLKKKNRRRPLLKVLESTAMVTVASEELQGSGGSPPRLSNGKISGLESTELKKSVSVALNNGSDCNGVSHEKGCSNASELACDTLNINPTKENEISSVSLSAENGSSDRLSVEVPLAGEEKQSAGVSTVVVDSSTDKSQVSGLIRQNSQNSQAEGVLLRNNETGSTSSEAIDAYIRQSFDKGTSKWQLKGKRNLRKTSRNRNQDPKKYPDADDEPNPSLAGLDNKFSGSSLQESKSPKKELVDDHEDGSKRLQPYRQSRFTVHSRYRTSDPTAKNSPSDPNLYEVRVEVKTNHKSPHVPLVSLMSKVNGKAIVGHPVTVELLEDGFCDQKLLMMISTEDDIVNDPQTIRHAKRGGSRIAKHMALKSSKSPKAKKSGLLPKKIRKLSSLTGGKKSEDRKSVAAVESNKPKGGPVIACIPIKLVFSRINEAVNGSARQTHHRV